ncbi:ABC transporter substrate-binding protein [Cognatishimia activa]|uniref:ABC-type thiamine transport system, periplasmic component n=1 Tax=Cognatishimia activa TaxID=1715691 RepID=A0A0N7MB62_9RHOB|nr:ABC transporter substrate-binding protein [Cognatishimia activa]CUI39286.1 hypothetical protein TA5113_00367 [Cognatishimia activa]CUK24520.1 hypothetical protein TA5114_00305 [Cognatishimia activa]
MRYFILLILTLIPAFALGQEWEEEARFGNEGAQSTLRVISSTDTSFFAPVIETFVAKSPSVAISYFVTSTAELNRIVRENPSGYDVVISSAMDLQLKLANDGFAKELTVDGLPDWAKWRSSLFAFTTEPAAIVMNKKAFPDGRIPQTRQELIQAMRDRPEEFSGRIGTYDVRESGLGYLFATQDARASETYWRLTEVMGSLKARLYCCSSAMIDDLVTGELAVAYNVLGSYAKARQDTSDQLQIVLPSDFPTTMMRTALVSAQSSQPQIAEDFVQHLISLQTGSTDNNMPLPPLDVENAVTGRSNIALEPALMTYLDRLKRRNFLKEWESAIIQGQ